MPDNIKVVIDANIAIAASIYYDQGNAVPIKHRIHDEASALVEHLAESGNGYVVPTVRTEAIGALPWAVEDAVGRRYAGTSVARMESSYYEISIRSRNVMEKVFRSPNMAHTYPEQVAFNLILVERMSKSLMDRYAALTGRGITARGRAVDPPGAHIPHEALQLWRFAKKHPNKGDQRILAEAAAFRATLPAGSRVMIASSDTGFFSPYRHAGGVSDTVTAEMRKRFGILRDHPEAILRMVRGAA